MPAGYVRPTYQSNAEKHKTNQQKHRENEAKAQPRTDRTTSDHTKAKEPKKGVEAVTDLHTLQIKSDKGTQIVEVSGTGAGVKIRCVDRTRRSLSVHVFSECIEGLIKALETIKEQSKVVGIEEPDT